jgi:hypothetical protein
VAAAGCSCRGHSASLTLVSEDDVDPNATLQWLRGLAEEIIAGRDDGGAAVELAGLVLDLDVFLCKGGAPPREWQATTTTTFPTRKGGQHA